MSLDRRDTVMRLRRLLSKAMCWLVGAFVDGELDDELRDAFDAHLQGCEKCRTLQVDAVVTNAVERLEEKADDACQNLRRPAIGMMAAASPRNVAAQRVVAAVTRLSAAGFTSAGTAAQLGLHNTTVRGIAKRHSIPLPVIRVGRPRRVAR